ncbi:MAG: DNA polymerase III subunit delta [Candidatus Cloacimonadaceae bacterium]
MKKTALNALEFGSHRAKIGDNFLLVGEDAYLIDRIISQISRSIKEGGDVDTTLIYGDDMSYGELADHLDSYTIFSDAKLLIIKNAEALNKRSLDLLGSYFDDPLDSQSLIIVSAKVDGKFTAWKKATAGSLRVNCDPPKFSRDIRSWLSTELRRIGKSMSAQAIDDFISRIEMDYYTAANELIKLDILTGKRDQITAKDLEISLSGKRLGTRIDFYRAIGAGNLPAAIRHLHLMIDSEMEPIRILFQLIQLFNTLWKIQLLRQRRVSDGEITAKYLFELFFSQRKEYMNFARKYPLPALEKIMDILYETDYELKSSPIDRNMIIELCLIKIMGTI